MSRVTTTARRGETGSSVLVYFCRYDGRINSVDADDVLMCYRCLGPGINDCRKAAELTVSR